MDLLNVDDLVVLKPVNDLFTNFVDYRQYRPLKTSERYDDDVAHEMSRMTKTVPVEMKDRMVDGRDPVSIITFLQDLKAMCDACNVHEGAVLWLFKYFLSSPVKSVTKARVTLPTDTMKPQEGCLTNVLAVINFLIKRYATDNNIATVDGDIPIFRQETLSATEYAQQLWERTLNFVSV